MAADDGFDDVYVMSGPGGRYAIPYRIRRSSQLDTASGGVVWFFEYAQDPRRPNEWGPRGKVVQRDGAFHSVYGVHETPRAALLARVLDAP